MLCCENCFGDRYISKQLVPRYSEETGDCPNCNSTHVSLISSEKLRSYFELVVGIYNQSSTGKNLVEILREDWCLFNRDNISQGDAQILLGEILDDANFLRQTFIPSAQCNTQRLSQWNSLKNELMHENRFFPQSKVDRERFENLLSALIVDEEELPDIWYRARIQKDETAYGIGNMGAPPKKLASHGRANPAGIPYLYLGSEPNTAIAEVRPHPGEKVSVAEFEVDRTIKLVDLRSPRKLISPFPLSEESEVAALRGDISFLESLGAELTIPVLPNAAAINYIPSQYLCEFIKKCRYHGVVYKSSISEGFNLALFYPEMAQGTNVSQHRVDSVAVRTEAI